MGVVVLGGVGLDGGSSGYQPVVGQQGSMLATLVAALPGAASFDELIESLWRGRPPKTARNGLSVVANRLRRRLEADGFALLTEGEAYRIEGPRHAIDLLRFLDGVETGRASLATDPATARAVLSESIGLWRGDAFHPHRDTDRIMVSAAHAEGVRADAEELLAEALLASGESDAAAGLATELVASEPLRERRWELLMLSLYRAGRQAEALRAFEQAAEVLREELGLDPSPALVTLQHGILHHDVALGPPPAPPATGWANRPTPAPRRHIAGPATSFVGRDLELKQIDDLFATNRLVTLVGPGGSGKTRLAREWVGLRVEEPVEWVDLAPMSSSSFDSDLAGHFEQAEIGGAIAAAIATELEAWAGTLVLDNCEHVIDGAAAVAESIARACVDVRVLATSRVSLGTESEVLLPVPPLDEAAAIDLLLERSFGAGPVPDLADEDLVELVQRVDGLPLNLELVAGLLRHRDIGDVSARLAQSIEVVTSPRRTDERHRGIAATIDWSLQLLDASVTTTFERLGVMAGPFSAADATALLGADADADLATLADHSLVSTVDLGGSRHFQLLETMRVHARERLEARGTLDEWRDGHAAAFRRLAAELHQRRRAGDDTGTEIDHRLDQFRAAYRWSRERDDVATMRAFAEDLGHHFARRRLMAESAWILEVLDHPASADGPDRLGLLADSAYAAWFTGDLDRAAELAGAARALAEAGPHEMPCLVHNVEFRIAANRREMETAATALLEWVAAATAQDDENEMFESMVSLCTGSIYTEHYHEASVCAAEAARMALERESPSRLAVARWAEAYVDYAETAAAGSADLEDALRGFVEGRRLATASRYATVANWCDDMIVACLRRLGRLDEAKDLLRQALERWKSKPVGTHLGLNQALKETVMVLVADNRMEAAATVARARRKLAVDSPLCPADERAIRDAEAGLGDLEAGWPTDPIEAGLAALSPSVTQE